MVVEMIMNCFRLKEEERPLVTPFSVRLSESHLNKTRLAGWLGGWYMASGCCRKQAGWLRQEKGSKATSKGMKPTSCFEDFSPLHS